MKKGLEIVQPIRSNTKLRNFLEKLKDRRINISLCLAVS
jgi:hypothetical protein